MTQNALRARIAQAAREEWTELDLCDDQLTALPPEIGQLTATLKLYGNPGFPDAQPLDV